MSFEVRRSWAVGDWVRYVDPFDSSAKKRLGRIEELDWLCDEPQIIISNGAMMTGIPLAIASGLVWTVGRPSDAG